LVLVARPHGETAAVVQLLTRERGRHAGLVQGGQGQRWRPVLQPGNAVRAHWQARLADHLGTYKLEPVASHAARFLDEPERLTCLAAAASICDEALPEREPHPACHAGLLALIEALDGAHWGEVYVQWEAMFLRELGFGLDLSACAGGGRNDDLAYVSPKSGRAVSAAAGEPYRERLLPLPGFLVGRGGGGPVEVAQGLRLTGHFLEKNVFDPRERPLPRARQRLAGYFPLPGL